MVKVSAQCEPVCGCGFVGGVHQGKFPFDRRGALLGGPFSDGVTHLARHRFNLFIVPDRRFHSVGFQVVIERVGMVLNQVRPLLVGIVGTTGSYQAQVTSTSDLYDANRGLAMSRAPWVLADEAPVARCGLSYRIRSENATERHHACRAL